jgi:hypothetical protein
MIDVVEQCFLVKRHEVKVIERLKLLHMLCGGFRCCVVVYEPAGDV